ncbi:protein-glutamine gamma-glutamyltransferase [Cohnella xylanilytica]|nr:protein-glutamine gamma-glutamyltransferase [Cohnella xylanilytica]
MYERKRASPTVYAYPSAGQLRHEMELRAAIVSAAEALAGSGLRFEDFDKAACNEQLWHLTKEGGFRIREDAAPANGIRDIFSNGWRYATECATATVIAVYRGVLATMRESEFNSLFSGLLLYDWHTDSDLRLTVRQDAKESFPGDLLYFANPDFDPDDAIWRGENVVKISDNLYYGHPFGIVPGETIVAGLNRHRRPGSSVWAYLKDDVVYPDYAYLSQFAAVGDPRRIFARIGSRRYVW